MVFPRCRCGTTASSPVQGKAPGRYRPCSHPTARGTLHLVMSTSLTGLKLNYLLFFHAPSAAFGTFHTRGEPSTHPEVCCFTHNVVLNSSGGSSSTFAGTLGTNGKVACFVSPLKETATYVGIVDHRSMQPHSETCLNWTQRRMPFFVLLGLRKRFFQPSK